MEDFAQALAAGMPPQLASRKAGYRQWTRDVDLQKRLVAAAPRVAEIRCQRLRAAADIGRLAARLEAMAAVILAGEVDVGKLREARQALADAGKLRAILHERLPEAEAAERRDADPIRVVNVTLSLEDWMDEYFGEETP